MMQYNLLNDDPQFLTSKRMIGPFGTVAKPAMIFSPKPYRIIGCAGPHDMAHSIGYFALEGYLKHACPDCGQVFQLTADPDEVCWDFIPKLSEHDSIAHHTGH